MKNFLTFVLYSVVITFFVGFASCTKTPTTETWEEPFSKYQDYILLEEIEIADQNCIVQVYSEFEPYYGYNNMAVLLLDKKTNEPMEGEVTYWPTFKTATATHTTLVEPSIDYKYRFMHHCGIVFTPQQNLIEAWRMNLIVRREASKTTDTLSFELDIKHPEHPRVYEFMYKEQNGRHKAYYAALCNPLSPISGPSGVNIVIYKNDNFNKIIPAVNFWVEFEKSLDSNYFSTARAEATNIPGHYSAYQYFSLPGVWRIRPVIARHMKVNNEKAYFDIPALENE